MLTRRVSVGMPVHDGAATLPRAQASVLGQTYENLEIILSDNASTDDTAAIAAAAAREDGRVRYFRQPKTIPAWENFRFVLDQATGDYFFWAADDDLHTPNFVEALVAALEASPAAVLAVADVVRFTAGADPSTGTVTSASALPSPRSYRQLVRDVILSNCSEFYGIFRTETLRGFPWSSFDYGPDHILLFYVRLRGEVVHVDNALFYESIRPRPKPRRLRVGQGFYRSMGRFRMVRFAWHLATMAAVAGGPAAMPSRRARVFADAYLTLRVTLGKVYLYEHAPEQLVRVWRRVKAPRPEPEPAG